MRSRSLSIAAVVLAAPLASAQDYWSLEKIRAVFEAEQGLESGEVPLPPPGGGADFTRHDPLTQLLEEGQFLTGLQVASGGMAEGESLMGIVQTDNTTESIWVWSRYRELTGDGRFDANVAAAWQYVLANPAWLEEGGGGPDGYYRIYNCAWALVAEPTYRQATGDAAFLPYALTCVGYLRANPLNLASTLNVQISGFAAGALYDFGLEQGDPGMRADAVALGELVRARSEANPSILSVEQWALSGGAILWGVLRSTFRENPGGRAWAETYGPMTKPWDAAGNWHLAHAGWYGLGRHEAWKASGEASFHTTHRTIYDRLISRDTDDDGGIMTQDSHPNTSDESWVSNYLAYMAIERVRPTVDAAAADDDAQLPPGSLWRVGFAFASDSAHQTEAAVVRVLLAEPGQPPSLLAGPRTLLLQPSFVLPARDLGIPIPAGAAPGVWTATIEVSDLLGTPYASDTVEVLVQ